MACLYVVLIITLIGMRHSSLLKPEEGTVDYP
jgi:hypothetical protein